MPTPEYPKAWPQEFILPGIVIYANRADYRDKIGKEPPDFNAALPPKYWTQGNGSDLNMPGPTKRDPYDVAETTGAFVVAPSGDRQLLGNKYRLSTRAQATNMLELFEEAFPDKALSLSKEMLDNGYRYVFEDSEPRRLWRVMDGNVPYNVGEMLKGMHERGPGKLAMRGDLIDWFAEERETSNGLAPVPVPTRALFPDEADPRPLMPGGQDLWVFKKITSDATDDGVTPGESLILDGIRRIEAKLDALA